MKLLKIFSKVLVGLVVFLIICLIFTISPIDRDDYRAMRYYQKMGETINAWQVPKDTADAFKAGWAVVNLTPNKPTPTAGYGKREGKLYQSVHDSVYVRAMVLSNAQKPIAIVSCDLLIFPPEVRNLLQEKLKTIGFDWSQVYVGTTHTHNSLGAWGKNAVGELFAGKYSQETVNHIANKVLEAIKKANENQQSAKVGYSEVNAKELVFNRLVGDKLGTTDPMVRILKVEKTTGETAIFTTFSAHATTLNADKNVLSADYPGELVKQLSKSANFVAFMAGAVGSTGPIGEDLKDDFQQMKNISTTLSNKILATIPDIKCESIKHLSLSNFEISLRNPQVKISENWRVRPWLFKTFFGDYPAEIKVLKIGNSVLVGTPCDYSGELMPEVIRTAQSKQLNLMITSFNGGYVGYITHDRHYDLDAYETRVMNWYGPQNGIYFQEIIQEILNKF